MLLADADLIAAATAAFGAAAPFVVWVVRRVFRMLDKILNNFTGIHEKVDGIDTRLRKIEPLAERVEAEFRPNGGSSLRDAINLLERRITILAGQHHARFEGDGLATYECDANGQCTYVSAALAEMFGMPADEFLGNGWVGAVMTTKERERVWNNWLYAVRNGIPYEDIYTILSHGKPLRVRAYARAVRDKEGKPLCYFGVVVIPPPDSKLVGGGSTSASSSPPPPPVSNDDPTGEHEPLPAT